MDVRHGDFESGVFGDRGRDVPATAAHGSCPLLLSHADSGFDSAGLDERNYHEVAPLAEDAAQLREQQLRLVYDARELPASLPDSAC